MPATYTDTNASIYLNDWFKGRVRVALSTYVNYLYNAAPEDENYDIKIQAANRLTSQAEMMVMQLVFTLSGDMEVQTAGPAIPDATLQMIVEKTIKKMVPIVPAAPPLSYGPVSYPPPPPFRPV
jgi:hypothetical protein